MLEWSLSIIVLLGGGFLIYKGVGNELAVSAITFVITFWFTRRQSEQTAAMLKNKDETKDGETK